MAGWKVIIKPERCIGCHACEIACEQTHGGIGNIQLRGAPVFCRHCEVPPCIISCYRNALEMQDGRVLLRRELCTNCGICVLACPFGAIMTTMIIRKIESRDVTNHKESLLGRFLSKQDLSRECQNLLVHKCDGCIEKAGAEKVCPACAATCPSGAIEYRKDISGILYSKRIKAYETYLLIDKTV